MPWLDNWVIFNVTVLGQLSHFSFSLFRKLRCIKLRATLMIWQMRIKRTRLAKSGWATIWYNWISNASLTPFSLGLWDLLTNCLWFLTASWKGLLIWNSVKQTKSIKGTSRKHYAQYICDSRIVLMCFSSTKLLCSILQHLREAGTNTLFE